MLIAFAVSRGAVSGASPLGFSFAIHNLLHRIRRRTNLRYLLMRDAL
jgi:hypothetical protein